MNYMMLGGDVTSQQYKQPKGSLYHKKIRVSPFRLTTEQWSLPGLRAEEFYRDYLAAETAEQRSALREARLPIMEGSELCLFGSLLLNEFEKYGDASKAAVSAFIRNFSVHYDKLVAVTIGEALLDHRMTAVWREFLPDVPWYKAIPNGPVKSC